MDLRPYIDLLRRRIWFVLEAIVIVAVVSGVASSLRPAKYASSGRVYLQPDSPAEQLNPGQVSVRDPGRFVQAQIDILRSEAVAQEAADSIGGTSANAIQHKTSVRSSPSSDVLEVTATDRDPKRARAIADAVINSYIENRRRSAVAGLERAAKDIDDRLEPLRAALADYDARIAALPPAEQAADGARSLRSLRDATATQYETLSARRQELAVNINLQRGGAEVIAEAKTPIDPVSPRPIRDGIAGALVGGILGAGIVLLREQLDDRLRTVADVERALSLPILAELPIDESARAGVAAILDPHSPLSEAVRSLRISVQYTGLDVPLKTIVITSAMPAEGKSIVAGNFAAVSALAGNRTVLVGADLRRPRLTSMFDVSSGARGLSEIVAGVPADAGDGNAPGPGASTNGGPPRLEDDIGGDMTQPMPNLVFLPAGRTPPNPVELLGSRRMSRVLAEMSAKADLVIIDTPPLLPVADAAIVAAQADGVILVVAMNETRREAAQRALNVLSHTNVRVLGVVVNKVPRRAVPYYYNGYGEEGANARAAPQSRKSWRPRLRSSLPT